MEIADELETCCNELESHKITSRKQACIDLTELLHHKKIVEFLNKNDGWWGRILCSIQQCLAKEHEKILEDNRRKGTVSTKAPFSTDVFTQFIKIAVKENASDVNFHKLFSYIVEALTDEEKKYLHHKFFNVVSQCFLLNSYMCSCLKESDWEKLYLSLKMKLSSDVDQIKCLSLVIKWGPLYKLPVSLLRDELGFVMKLRRVVTASSSKLQQGAFLELIFEFCKHISKDNRMACCKLGEEVFPVLKELYYSNLNEERMKSNLIEIFLLQVLVHHPKGVRYGHRSAYAFSWENWRDSLRSMYDILSDEINNSLEQTTRNQQFFVNKQLDGTFVRLFVEVCRQLFSNDCIRTDDERPTKRQRLEFTIADLVEKIRSSKSWPWSYPDMISNDDFRTLLDFFVQLQIDCKNIDLLRHIHTALLILLRIDRSETNNNTWGCVAETTLRLMVNQDDGNIHELLQELILRKYIPSHENLFQYYKPGALNVSKHNLKTLNVAFENFKYLQHDSSVKRDIIRWILASSSEQFCCSDVASILVYLILKQWPSNSLDIVESETKLFQDIEDVYMTTSLENLITGGAIIEKKDSRDGFYADKDLLKFLCDLLLNVANNLEVEKQTNDLFYVTVLIFKVSSFLLKFEVIQTDSNLLEFFEMCAKTLFGNIDLKVDKKNERRMEKVTEYVQILHTLFSTNICDFMSNKLRELVPENVVRDLFSGVWIEYEDITQEVVLKNFKESVMQTLVSFACGDKLLPIQEKALEALLEKEYICDKDGDYELILTLFKTIKTCTKSLSENTLSSMYNRFQNICEVRYHCYISTVTILDMFYDIFPIVASSDSDLYKTQFVEILYPFYINRLKYGPGMSISLLKCIGLAYEFDPSCEYTRWSDEEIIFEVPEFLTSEYQEVRLCAINILATFFKISSKIRILEQYHRQEIMFSKIVDKSVLILQIEGNLTEERIIDETVTRSASIFHTFASIMVASHLWVEEALFTLLKIVCDKNLDLTQLEYILVMVAEKLGFSSTSKLLEKYIIGLVNRWKPYNNFPFRIFDCDSKIKFYMKYWSLLSHNFVENEAVSLNQVASDFGKTLQTLIEESCPTLFSYCIGQEVSDLSLVTSNKIYHLLRDTIGVEKTRDVVKSDIEEVILCLTEFVSDEQNFKKRFGQSIIFPKVDNVRITVDEFHSCLQFIETSLYNGTSLIELLIEKNPEKIHFILLQFSRRIDTSIALEEKLRYFHLYSIFCGLCLDAVVAKPSLQTYLIRDLTHRLLHKIKNHKKQLELSEVSCKFFKLMLQKILPSLAEVVRHLFLIIVSRLKNIALDDCSISNMCIEMLELLIVDHRKYFKNEIEKLDSIPDTSKFAKIYSVHYSIKYGERKVTLDDEIKQFLELGENIDSLDECEHSLTHLRTLLTKNKDELRNLCLDLRKTRGFSNDCENSNLHKLICLLIPLSSVSSEAVRCLGEIGPSDLNTLILQPEKSIPDTKWTPWELLLTHVLTLLTKYITDSAIDVVKVASVALFEILATKEGRKVLDCGAINPDYLTPFSSIPLHKTPFNITIDTNIFLSTVQWVPEDSCHKTWVTKLVCAILQSFKDNAICIRLIDVCKTKIEFCEQILPLLIYTILNLNIASLNDKISTQIVTFFNNHWTTTVNNHPQITITTNKSSVQTMLNVVHFIRLQQNIRKREIKNFNLDYLKIAKAAHFCSAYFTALLYAEIWCQEQQSEYALSTCSSTKLDLIYDEVDDVTGNALQNILRQAYKAVGDVDALSGCGTAHLLHPSSRVEHYKELGRWDFVSHRYDLECVRGGPKRELVEGLKHANLYQLSLVCSEEPDYESLWRLSQWSYNKVDLSQSYDKCKFYAFKALVDNDEFSFVKAMDNGRVCVVQDFGTNMESIKNFYETFSKLQALKEMEDFAQATKNEEISELLVKWRVQDEIISNDYRYVEPIHAQRIVLLTDLLKKQSLGNTLREIIVDTIIDYARYARIEGQSRVAFRTLENLRQLETSNDIVAKIQIEDAQLCWSIEDVVTAKCILKQLSSNENVNPRFHAMALKMTGTWMVESASENRETIIKNYFQKSISLIKGEATKTKEDEKSILDTFNQLAKFADHEYQEVMTHIKSDIFQKKKKNIIKAQEAVSGVDVRSAPKDLKKAVALKTKQSCIDQIEINNIETDKNNLLQLALKYYLLNLIGSDDHNMTIFRLFSLLLENKDNEKIFPVLEKDLHKIPSYKFINILPQITPHISSTSELFCHAVNTTIERCAKDHPHHTLPLILALALSKKDRDYTESKTTVNDTRTQNAKAMLEKLKKVPTLASLITKMELLSDAIIELAYYNNDGADNKKFKVSTKAKIRKIKHYDDVLLPTYTLPVNTSCTYDRIVGISHFSDVFHNVGGINAPKRITCTGTDGVTRTQLIKGQDDLRQDAVMQQVFTIMNSLLNMNKQTKNLLIRTYKIVPLSMRSGILEWVEDTMPIGEYLTGEKGDGGAHAKFRPMDKSPSKCRVEYRNSCTSTKSSDERLRIFNKICDNIKPVFHKFFETQFPQPTVWYEKRRAYIHSVATSSICGYILGIGDRHVNNILIDKTTAEVIHIDFGIAFEQGRVLPTPETVPFRLTRDIVDGMGVSGVEGVFRRSCEKTAEVLRMHYQTIITILEVLLYDPLYDWTVSSAEANKRQKYEQDDELNTTIGGGNDDSDGSKDVNVTAERALLRLRMKLLGTESGKSTSVEHQVGTLIQQAVDPANLSKLFHGWQPYL